MVRAKHIVVYRAVISSDSEGATAVLGPHRSQGADQDSRHASLCFRLSGYERFTATPQGMVLFLVAQLDGAPQEVPVWRNPSTLTRPDFFGLPAPDAGR